jgi:hypothetical protein
MTEYVIVAVYVPMAHAEAVRVAMCDAGAGTVDDEHYDRVAYVNRCVGHHRVLDRAWDQAGLVGTEHENEEDRIEAICRRDRIGAVIQAIVAVHPYETPAITIYPTLTGEYKYWQD